MTTLKDISKATGVSVTQVSRALGGYGDVKKETKALVVEAARELGYRPNAMARGLKTGRWSSVVMVVPQDMEEYEESVLFEIVKGMSEEFAKRGERFFLHVSPRDVDPATAYEQLYRGGGIDGFVLLTPATNDPRIARLRSLSIPFVVHGRDPANPHLSVDIDNFEVARSMTAHLVAQGHRRIVFLNGPKGLSFSDERSDGFLTGLGVDIDPTAQTLYGDMTVKRGRDEARRLLSGPNAPTGFIAGNLMLAKGVYEAAASLALSIPGDVSVLAHDDGLTQHSAHEFVPQIGGSQSYLSDAWSDLAALLSEALETREPVKSAFQSFRFVEGASTSRLK